MKYKKILFSHSVGAIDFSKLHDHEEQFENSTVCPQATSRTQLHCFILVICISFEFTQHGFILPFFTHFCVFFF